MNSNELEVLSFMNNKFAISYMTRDTCDARDIVVLYMSLNNLMMTLNNSQSLEISYTILILLNDSLYLFRTSEVGSRILSTT